MTEENSRISSDLVRWLKMLALPRWAKFLLAIIMLATFCVAMHLLIDGLLQRNKDAISAAISIFTVALPIGLLLVALVFGDGGEKKLKQLTNQVLSGDVPQAIRENLRSGGLSDAQLSFVTRGYIADYELAAMVSPRPIQALRFRIELNIKKVNVVFWIPNPTPTLDARAILEVNEATKSCLLGAEREGYALNPVARPDAEGKGHAIIFIRSLHDDFLIEPAQRLYFAQDLAFFVRGMVDARLESA